MAKTTSGSTGAQVATAVEKLTRQSGLKKLPEARRSPSLIKYRLWYDEIGRKVGLWDNYFRIGIAIPTL
ncbi:MAG TPA: hypothetical protein DCY88_04960 [Cyanobacteria bacterium UBA11372]|nr:hypothetical protein [Cyanobacteria bacterium UBA11372]